MFTALALPPSRMVFAEKQTTPTVIVDAGHGGIDGGAVGETGATEKKINLEIAKKICKPNYTGKLYHILARHKYNESLKETPESIAFIKRLKI